MEEKIVEFVDGQFKNARTRILEHLKKDTSSEYRFIPLTDKAMSIIEKAQTFNPNSEFMFVRNLERLTSRAVAYWFEKYCRMADTTYKSPHSVRRTTASLLHTAGMPLDMVRDILGQVDERTTLGYIYNPKTEQENLDILNNA